MNRLRVRRFSRALALALAVLGGVPLGARAQTAPATTFWFAGTRLIFDAPVALDGDIAVSIHDSGLARLLARVGATIAYQPQQRYIVVTAADHRIVSFTVGDVHYAVGGVVATAPFAPFFDGNDVIVPLFAIARALYVEPVAAGNETIFEPQIGTLDVRPDGRRTIVTLHGATALRYALSAETPDRLSVTFSGVGSALAAQRRIGGGIDEVDVAVTGSAKNPAATVTIVAPSGSQHAVTTSASPYDFTIVFAPAGVALDGSGASASTAASAPPPPPMPVAAAPRPLAPALTAPPVGGSSAAAPQTGPARVTDVAIEDRPDGSVSVRLAIDGTATYDWHRLRDDRWYLDVADAQLTQAGRDERPNTAAVESVRVREIGTPDAPVVRVAFTLRGDNQVVVTPVDESLTITAANAADPDLARTGNGQIGGATVAQSTPESPAGPPVAPIATAPPPTGWKFGGPAPGLGGNRIIVIDPGHGGDDVGTAHNGLVEKELTLDIARRLRALLVEAGWTVRMTRDSDIDPFSAATYASFATDGRPNPTDRAYLQTRCDVANAVNARLFISIHINYSDSPSVRGTTFYYTKPQDVPLAQALERAVIPQAGTQDDGVVKSNLYVTKHTTMPAVLVETAFISNPGDVARLEEPRFLQNVAAGIAAGVKAYAGAVPATPPADQ